MPRRRSTSSSTGRPWVSQPRLARDAVPAHRLVAREEVFEDARKMDARRGARWPWADLRRTRTPGRRRALEALLEDAMLFPEREDARVERREVDARGHLAEPGSLVAHVTRFRRAAGPRAGRPAGRNVGRPSLPDTAGLAAPPATHAPSSRWYARRRAASSTTSPASRARS